MTKPNNPGQLFYKDMFKLAPNTELIYHYRDAWSEWVGQNYQFLKVGLVEYDNKYYRWTLFYRTESGQESQYWFSTFGIVAYPDTKHWSDGYLTLRYPNEEETK